MEALTYRKVNASARELQTRLERDIRRIFGNLAYRCNRIVERAREVEALPPNDIETMEGRPEARAEVRTKFKPDTLGKKAICVPLHI